jgi:hypothetical protein
MGAVSRWPPELAPVPDDLVCLSIDVEWACAEVLADTLALLDQRGLRATLFCTHPGVGAPGHERALHPNFRRRGDTMRAFRAAPGRDDGPSDVEAYRHVVATTREFCPEARGVRAHALFYESDLLPVYREAGLEYDSSYFLPLVDSLRPCRKEHDILELPIYYMDHWDLGAGATGFTLADLRLDGPGLKVFDFHPNLVYLNCAGLAQYEASRASYHDAAALRRQRHAGRGVRTLFLELLDHLAGRGVPTMTLGEVNAAARDGRPAVAAAEVEA